MKHPLHRKAGTVLGDSRKLIWGRKVGGRFAWQPEIGCATYLFAPKVAPMAGSRAWDGGLMSYILLPRRMAVGWMGGFLDLKKLADYRSEKRMPSIHACIGILFLAGPGAVAWIRNPLGYCADGHVALYVLYRLTFKLEQ